MRTLVAIIHHDIQLSVRQGDGTDSLTVIGFFVLTVALFPFGIGLDPYILERSGVGIIWIMSLLATLLALDRLFQSDYTDGSLDLLISTPMPLFLIVLCKVSAHWLTTSFPLIIITPILAMLLGIKGEVTGTLLTSMILGTPTMSLIGAVGAALVLGARQSNVLLPLVILPFYIPVLVFGVTATDVIGTALQAQASLLLLVALLCIALPLCPLITAVALRQALT